MEILNASDAKREFGELLLKAQSSPVGINKNGKPVAVVISVDEYEQLELLREQQLKAAIQAGVKDIENDKVAEGSRVFHRLRDRTS